MGHWTIKPAVQTAGHNKGFQILVFVLTQLHCGQWSILSAKFDCPVARQIFSLLSPAHDCETGLFQISWNSFTHLSEIKSATKRFSYSNLRIGHNKCALSQ